MATSACPQLNALSHGATAESLFIVGEDPAEFDNLLSESYAFYQPANPQDSAVVYDSVHARWFVTRRQRVQSKYEHHLHKMKSDITTWTTEDFHQLNLFDRYLTQAERALRRALVNVQVLRKEKISTEHWREQLALQRRRVDLQREKFEFAKAKEETKQQQRRHAARHQPSPYVDPVTELHNELNKPIQHDKTLNCSVIVQRSFMRNHNGVAHIDSIEPTHDEVRELIENGGPQLVVRHFCFFKDVPADYSFLLEDGSAPRTLNKRSFFRRNLSFAEYLALADRENELEDNQEHVEPDDVEDEDVSLSDEAWLAWQWKVLMIMR